ncbi:UDP-N-acetylmuramoyl-L-alanine--D-glutamate ligase, partial [Xanthomonas perforans]|nr:UDP-N-acetylmuramoyl-L-alanine--D-glutamate ligase [Xanthomonas perforans]
LRTRLPTQALTVFCNAEEAREIDALEDAALQVETAASAQALGRFEIVVKSPGISPYRAEALVAAAQGTCFIGGTALWFAEHAQADGSVPGVICVTGTKGKSTTTRYWGSCQRRAGDAARWFANLGYPW